MLAHFQENQSISGGGLASALSPLSLNGYCQIIILGSISGDTSYTQCHESELVFTARWFVE